jgi:psiF repeat
LSSAEGPRVEFPGAPDISGRRGGQTITTRVTFQMRIKALAGAAALCVFVSGAALAFDAATDDKGGPAPPAAAQGSGARSARSLECSQKADSQNLHGKPRKHFMRDCKHSD